MNFLNQSFTTATCAIIALAVVMNGAHLKDLGGQLVASISDKKIGSDDQSLSVKAVSELHNHVDKQIGKTFNSTDATQADQRSLRLLRQQQRKDLPERLLNKLRELWQLNPFVV